MVFNKLIFNTTVWKALNCKVNFSHFISMIWLAVSVMVLFVLFVSGPKEAAYL